MSYIHFRNCNDDSVSRTVRSFINSIRTNEQDLFPEAGLSTSNALETLYEEMEALRGTFLFVLVEIDHLSDPDSLLYKLSRARANLDAARVGVIGISNNYTFRSSLSPKLKDTLMEKELAFSPYDADELQLTLTARAEKAFVDSAFKYSAIRLAAAKAAKDVGSARQAIDLLREGGDVAEEQGTATITDGHIEVAAARVQRGRVQDKLRGQTMHGQLILESLAQIEENRDDPARSKEIQAVYERVARNGGHDPLTTLESV